MSNTQIDPSGIIEKIKKDLKEEIGEEIFNVWLGPKTIPTWNIMPNKKLVLIMHDVHLRAHISRTFLSDIENVLKKSSLDYEVELKFEQSLRNTTQEGRTSVPLTNNKNKHPGNLPGMEPIRLQLPVGNTFEAFSVGEGNELAYAACKNVADNATRKQSAPIFIYAPTGYGKSHLLYAVIYEVLKSTKLVPTYVMTADFVKEMFAGLKTGTMASFQAKYCASRMFLMDDVHMLEGKKKTQEELLLVLKTLTRRNIPVVVTSTINPLGLEGTIREELLSLLISGIIAPIESAKQDNKSQMVLHYAESAGLSLDEKIVDYLARTLNGDVRKITSIIYTLHSRQSLLGQNIDLALAENIVGKVISPTSNKLTSQNILELVAGEFRVSTKDITSKSRKKVFTMPRHLIMWLATRHTEETHELIGKTVGRNHSSVNHAVKEVEKKLASDTVYRDQVELLKARLKL